ncbi:RHS repeat-associated core domain-containing protein [Piscirickettsia litoralis]|uniref:Teneurin-like YD-shell domain-containing protein n=1 Tax=Piscirickettsia litoralis TaxID=1891921 RepID=A0ABX3A5L6_9GAMM|nr:RHS repeat-associated core domain-containing protein [Piscirickettsia litoralis]ODN41414.1 hypothetical protein BGC07_16760 [Piscirickettsia litoralis]
MKRKNKPLRLKLIASSLLTVFALSNVYAEQGQYDFTYSDKQTQYSNPLGGKTTETFTTINGKKVSTQVIQTLPNSSTQITTKYGYDANGRPAYIKYPNGAETFYYYSDAGLLDSKIEAKGTPLELRTSYQWDTTTRLPTSVSINGFYTKKFTYDKHAQPLSVTLTDGQSSRVWQYTYDKNELVSTSQAPYNTPDQLTHYKYANGLLSSITNSLGQTTTFDAYDAGGYLTQSTGANGVKTTYSYDPMDLLTGVTVNGATTQYKYDDDNHISEIVLPDGVTKKFTYNYWGHLKDKTDSQSNQVIYTLNSLGEPIEQTIKTKAGNRLESNKYTYDGFGRLSSIIDAYGNTIKYQYDNSGNISSIIDALQHTSTSTYNANNQIDKSTTALKQSVSYTYDPLGHITSVTDYNGNKTTYTYDKYGDLIELNSPDKGKITYSYNAAGQLTQETVANGITAQYSYDALNRLTNIKYPHSTIHYTFDQGAYGKGRLSSVATDQSNVAFTYNPWGSVTSEAYTDGQKQFKVNYDYNIAQRLQSITYPSGKKVTFSYDNDGRVNTVKLDETAIATNIKYLPFGPMNSMKLGNGATLSREYNLNYQLTHQAVNNSSDDSYIYDASGSITEFKNNLTPTENKTYSYDATDRLTSVKSQLETINYTYDANGNRLTEASSSKGQSNNQYNSKNNQLVNSASKTVTHDAVGNITALGDEAFTYDDQKHLLSVSKAGKPLASYSYNGLGQRISKKYGSNEAYYIYDLNGKLIEINDNGKITDFIYLNNEPLAEVTQGQVYYFINNSLGTPEYLVDSANKSQWHGNVYPFSVNASGSVNQPLRFAGQLDDAVTGLVYNNARDYIPGLGRYLQADPLGLASGSLNNYAYVANNPVNLSDPHGTCIEDACIVEGAAVAAVVEEAAPIVAEVGEYVAEEIEQGVNSVIEYFEGSSEPAAIADETGASSEQICIPKINGRNPINSKYAGQTHPSGVKFNDQGFPDFSPYSRAETQIEGLTGRYSTDERLANQDIGLSSTPEGYVWHHVEDGETMQLVPKNIHRAARHTGGAAIIKNGGFD